MSADVIPILGSANPPAASPPTKPTRKKRRASLSRAQLAQRIESERSKLFGVLGIVDTVRELLRESKFDNCGWALQTAYEILDDVAGAMQADVFLDVEGGEYRE
jgi:hypothetical protein